MAAVKPNSQKPAHDVDASGARCHPLAPDPVQSKDRLLIFTLDRDGVDPRTAQRFEERFTIGAIGFAPPNVGTHVVGRQEHHLKAS